MTHDTLTIGRVRMAVSRAITVAVHSNVLIAGDRREGIRTVPVLFGPATTRRVAQLMNLGAAVAVVALV